jgi:hypothetical protein
VPRSARHLLASAIAAATLALAAGGCTTGEKSSLTEITTPSPPNPCLRQPEGIAQDGVNDEQGGSTPGIDPCDNPGN